MPDRTAPRQAALWFAAQGYPVLPLHSLTDTGACTCGDAACLSPGKHPFAPFAPHGLKDATVEAGIIRGWFAEHYWLSYGIVTDELLVIDVDPRNGGDQTWASISCQPTRALPHTWRVRTGGGGEHICFQNTLGIKGGDLDRGIEIKAKGGYIVGVGCKHVSGRLYAWQPQCSPKHAPLAEPPPWLKHLTGGDQLSARFMCRDFFTFTPQFKLVVAGNHKPSLNTVDEAMRRRFNLVPFTVTIPPHERDVSLTEKLKAEWPQILQWLIDGCADWQEHGLAAPKAVSSAREEYLAVQDTVKNWIAECLVEEPRAETRSSVLYSSWKLWTEANGEFAGSNKALSQKLMDQGLVSYKKGGVMVFRGVTVAG
jgi:Bifunctional DNA primase/polymerase, N-terminal